MAVLSRAFFQIAALIFRYDSPKRVTNGAAEPSNAMGKVKRMAHKGKGRVSPAWRALLIPLFLGYFRLLSFLDIGTMEFIRNIKEAPFLEYGRNYAMLAACVVGFALLLFASADRRGMLAAGLILAASPVWMNGFVVTYNIGSAGAKAVGEIRIDGWARLLSAVCASLWGLLMVRGPKKREWEKAVMGALFVVLIAYRTATEDADSVFWMYDAYTMGVSLCVGGAVDAVNSAPTIPDALVPLTACGWVAAGLCFGVVSMEAALYGAILLSLVGATALLCRKPVRKRYIGYIAAFAGIAASAASALIQRGGLI